MNRQINFRFLGVMVAILAVVAVTSNVLHGYQVKRNAGYLLAQAKKAQLGEKPDVPAAMKYLNHYLTLRPEDAAARARFVAILGGRAKHYKEKEQAYLAIEKLFRDHPGVEQALRDDPALAAERDQKAENPHLAATAADQMNLRRRAAELAMEIAQFGEAKVHLEAAVKDQPQEGELFVLLGYCDERLGRADEAEKMYAKAAAIDPARVEPYQELARVRRRNGKAAEADKAIEEMLRANPASTRVRLAAVGYYKGQGQLETARRNLAALPAELAHGDKDVLLVTADLAMAERNDAAARQALEAGLKAYPDEVEFYMLSARLELARGKRAEAVAFVQRIVPKLTAQSRFTFPVAELLLDANEAVEARKLTDRLKGESVDTEFIDYLEARLFLADGLAVKAEEKLLRCRTSFARTPVMAGRTELLLADCYARLGKPDLQLKATELALKTDPTDVMARAAHAQALAATGKTDQARDVYESLIPRSGQFALVVARLELARRDPAGAEAALAKAPPRLKETTEYQLLAAQVAAQSAAFSGRKEKYDEALKMLEALRAKDPKDYRAWAYLASAKPDVKDGLALLDQAQPVVDDQVGLRLARANLLLRKPPFDLPALRQLEQGADAFPEADRDRLAVGLVGAYRYASAPADAERVLRPVLARKPRDLGLLFQLFELLLPKGNVPELGDLAKKMAEAEGEDGATWRFVEAWAAWQQYRGDAKPETLRHARTRLAEVVKRRPEWYLPALLEGEIDEAEGRIDDAIQHYTRAIQAGAQRENVVANTANLLLARRRYDDARQLLDGLRRKTAAQTDAIDRLDALTAANLGESREDLLARVERSLPKDSTDYRNHLVRGGLLASLGRPADAEAAHRRAVALAPAAPEAWVSLVFFLARADRAADAKAEIGNATTALPADKKATALATCYEVVKDRAEAEKHYLLAVKETGERPEARRNLATFYLNGGEAAKAEPILQQLQSADPANRRWARRMLAVTLAAGGDYARGEKALALLEANLLETPNDPTDLRVRALVQANRPGGRRQAIKDLEAMFVRMPPSPGEEFLLARLLESDGEWAKASDRFVSLLSKKATDNPLYVYHYARSLLQHDEVPAAEKWLERLKGREKDAGLLILELQARIDAARGRPAEAAAKLKGYARDDFAKRKDPDVFRRVGLLLAELKATAEAEGLIREYVAAVEPKTPAAALILAEFLARHQNKVDEALKLCADAVAKIDPDVVARVAVAVVRLGEPTAAHFAQAEEIIQRARQAKPMSKDIPVSFADLRDAQGQYADAIRMYRDILQTNPANTLALNNVAWLLALHEKKRDEALEFVGKAIAVRGPDANLIDTQGVVRLATGDPQQAVTDLTHAIASGARPELYFHLAQAYHKQGNLAEAMRAMRKARELELSKKDLHKLEWADYDALTKLVQGK
jgi:tetratricopeptide (TPR) repeat protein